MTSSNRLSAATEYVRAGGTEVLQIKGTWGQYLYHDHLGSRVAMADSAAGIWWNEAYNPYGEKRIDPDRNKDNLGFAGHVQDDVTGLTYMQARYYDPVTGRFLSPDPVQFSPGAPQMFNRYSYVNNDPINLRDPDGRCPNCVSAAIGAGFGALVGGGLELANQLTDDKKGISLSRVGISAGKGALAGGIIGGTGCVGCGAVAAGLAGAADGAVTARANGEHVIAGAAGQATVDGVSTFVGGKAGQVVTGKIAGAVAETVGTVGGATATQAGINAGTDAAGVAADAFQAGVEAAAPAFSEGVDQLQNMGDNFTPSCSRQEEGC